MKYLSDIIKIINKNLHYFHLIKTNFDLISSLNNLHLSYFSNIMNLKNLNFPKNLSFHGVMNDFFWSLGKYSDYSDPMNPPEVFPKSLRCWSVGFPRNPHLLGY